MKFRFINSSSDNSLQFKTPDGVECEIFKLGSQWCIREVGSELYNYSSNDPQDIMRKLINIINYYNK